MPLNLATAVVNSSNLPTDIFEFFWCEKNLSAEGDYTLLDLLCTDFQHGVESLRYMGPLNTDRTLLCAAMMRALADLINDTRGLPEIIQLAGCGPAIDKLASGDPGKLANFVRYLNEKRDNHRMQRNALQDAKEPTFFDLQELETVLRRLNATSALQGVAEFFANAPSSRYTPRWENVAGYAVQLKEAALSPWQRSGRSGKDFPATTRQRNAFNKAFALAFLQQYEKPTYKWHM